MTVHSEIRLGALAPVHFLLLDHCGMSSNLFPLALSFPSLKKKKLFWLHRVFIAACTGSVIVAPGLSQVVKLLIQTILPSHMLCLQETPLPLPLMVSPHAGDFEFQKSYKNEAHQAKIMSGQKKSRICSLGQQCETLNLLPKIKFDIFVALAAALSLTVLKKMQYRI